MDSKGELFRCPVCKGPLIITNHLEHFPCCSCGFYIPVIEGIPVLVKNHSVVQRMIDNAKQTGRSQWYEEPQMLQWQGPYRHHLLKRKTYVESILASYAKQVSGPILGLDLGCGDGENIAWFSKYLSSTYASDYNLLRLIRASRVPVLKQLFMAEVTDYPTLDSSFDVIFLNHVLEHIPDDERALSEVYRILKVGGLLILGVPNEGAFLWQLAYKLQPKSRATSDHMHFYKAKVLVEKCSKVGFIVKEVHPIGWGVPHWWLDSKIRGYKVMDDLLESIGRVLLPSQATSLYLILSK